MGVCLLLRCLLAVVTVQLCNCVSVVVGMDAELNMSPDNDDGQTEDNIVSQWREVSANERHEMRERVDEICRPLGFDTRLVVIRRANSLALIFLCMTLSAIKSLRHHLRTQQLRYIVTDLFTFLSRRASTVFVNRLTWPLTDYERCKEYFRSSQGKQWI